MTANVTQGWASAWACRWVSDADIRHYTVTVCCEFLIKNFAAVIDDFGNLVKVAA